LHVAFIHDALPEYRRPLFDLIGRRHRVNFFFTDARSESLPEGSVRVKGFRVPEMSDFVIAPRLLGKLVEVHRRDPFDVVLLPDLGFFSCHIGYLFSRSARLPYVLWTGEWCPVRHPRRWAMRPLEGGIAKGAAACLAYSSRTQQRLEQLGVPAERIRVAGNASDYRYSQPSRGELDRVRREWSIEDRQVILFLGRLLEFKGPDILLEAFAGLEPSRKAFLVLAGQGPLLHRLQQQVRRRRMAHVHFTGHTVESSREKDLLYGLASVFVLPSRRWRTAEPWGLVLNEAASASLPIVTTQWAGAVGDLIRDGETGFVIPAEDPPSLGAMIMEILENPHQAKERGLRARDVASGFTIDRIADALDWGIRTAEAAK
jgi:glycosyltransferase involved in cell wall biosynthesis